MPDTDSITLVKEFTYRGALEEWSNTYHLDGTTPSSDAEWKALADAIWNTEKAIVKSTTKLVKAYGYEAGSENSVAQIDYRAGSQTGLAGTLSAGVGANAQGDAAVWIRAKRATNSSKGKKVYARKYFHGAVVAGATGDDVATEQKTALTAHATAMLAGGLPGGMKWVAPQGGALSQPGISQFVTTRTLKRRGKRP